MLGTTKKSKTLPLNDTLSVLLEQLGEDCQNVLRLLAQLRRDGLSSEEIEEILVGLSASVVHLRVHVSELQGFITDELERIRRTRS